MAQAETRTRGYNQIERCALTQSLAGYALKPVPERLLPPLDGWDDSGAAGLPGAAGRPSRLLRPSLAEICDSNLRGMLLDSMASRLL